MYEYEYEYVSQMLSSGFSISNMKRVVTASIWVLDLQSGAICLENPPGESGFITGHQGISLKVRAEPTNHQDLTQHSGHVGPLVPTANHIIRT